MLRDLLGDELAGKFKRGLILATVIFAFVTFATLQSVKKEREQAAAQKAHDAASCQYERAMTDDDAMIQCQNAAALFGQDISANPTRLSACVENRERKIAQCTAKGL